MGREQATIQPFSSISPSDIALTRGDESEERRRRAFERHWVTWPIRSLFEEARRTLEPEGTAGP
jgi:hypothetical protein